MMNWIKCKDFKIILVILLISMIKFNVCNMIDVDLFECLFCCYF